MTFIINKLSDEKIFVVDFALSVCLPDDDSCLLPTVDIMKGTRIPIPLCNTDFSLSMFVCRYVSFVFKLNINDVM